MQSPDKERDAATFRAATARLGQAFNRETMPPAALAEYDSIGERADDLIASARRALPALPPIHFDFVINGAVNAFAFGSSGRYFIGLNTGTVYMLRLVIGRMLADPRILLSVGNASEEQPDLPTIIGYTPDAERMYRDNVLQTPRNVDRRAYAMFLQDQALMFLIGHEITHISRGHVAYLQQERRLSYYSELSAFGADDGELKLERQCLEQDADRRSIMSRIDSLRVTHASGEYDGFPWAGSDKGPERLIRDWSLSIGIVFQLFGSVRFSSSRLSELSYPPVPLRRQYAEGVARFVIEKAWDPRLREAAWEGIRWGREESDHAFATILQEGMEPEAEASDGQAGTEHLMRLQDYWNSTMVEKLRPYSYEF